jgi:3-hydroxyisobutyryl-CoA hydrolase
MDGITMGGGVGLSVHAPFRIATEKTVFAMPETGIGLFPDVGGSFFLPRLDGYTGTWLALTSEQLRGPEVMWAGVATHYLDSTSLESLTQRLSELVFKDYASLDEQCQSVNEAIDEFVTGLPREYVMDVVGEKREAIDRCFKFNTIQEIMHALSKETGSNKLWAKKTLETLRGKSPTSLHVTLRAMRLGNKWDISETFQREYHMAGKFMESHDFVEGVQAKLIKPVRTPKWDPVNIEDVTNGEVDEFFKVEGAERLRLYKDRTYNQYPYTNYGLPKEAEVKRAITQGGKRMKLEQMVNAFLHEKNGKQDVADKVKDIIQRKCEVDGEGYLQWVGE